MSHNSPGDTPDTASKGTNARLENLVAEYLGRLNDGERLDRARILAQHPELGEAIVGELEAFVDLRGGADDAEPLGILGDYTLRRQIGRGGMGVVYDAWQGSLDRQVALKVLPAGFAVDEKAFMRFMREARTAAQLNHQNVVRVYGMGQEENTPYYSMEYDEGETLAQILARVRTDEAKEEREKNLLETLAQRFHKENAAETARPDGLPATDTAARADTAGAGETDPGCYATIAGAFAGVADGLQHAHSRGVIHRDIKPSNLILDDEGRLRVLDFGLARLDGQQSLTTTGEFLGTPLYMSPEQTRARKIPIDHRTDVYSLGARR